jgi:DeoR/GlpR family transcriptional regulator of sugar metabolism
MLKEERQQRILEMLRQEGKVMASGLSSILEVSEDTIRRDLNDLAGEKLIQRVHGGALLRAPEKGGFIARQKQGTNVKAELARVAVQFVRDGQVIIMDGGTTTLQVAQMLPQELQATIITNSPPVAIALADYPRLEVYLLGGKIYKDSLVTVGVDPVEKLRSVRADLCLLGICSLHPESGISVPNMDEAQVKQAMLASAAEVVALASEEKLNTAAQYIVGPIHELTHLVTEKSVPEEILAPYRKSGITVLQG